MKSIFDNLVLYEIVLLFLGIFLFVILSAGLIYYIVKKEEIKKLLTFFLIPIIMIAYPSIKEIQIGDNKMVMYEKIEEALKNPTDSINLKELAKVTKKVEYRSKKTVNDLTALSKSYYILGNSDKAIFYANEALKKERLESKLKYAKKDKPIIKSPSLIIKDSLKKPMISKSNSKKIELQDIKVLAGVQKEIKRNSLLLKDTTRLNKKLKQLKLKKNSKAYQYFINKNLKGVQLTRKIN